MRESNLQPDMATLLQRVLSLEQRKGYRDTAVAGGIQRFLDQQTPIWRKHAPHHHVLIDEICRLFARYQQASVTERKQIVEQALTLLTHAAPPTHTQAVSPAPDTHITGHPVLRTRYHHSARPQSIRPPSDLTLDSPVTALAGVGRQRAHQLAGLGVHTIGDLLYLAPRRYEDYRTIQPIGKLARLFAAQRTDGEVRCTVIGTLTTLEQRESQSGVRYVYAEITDQTGTMPIIWFNPYVARQLQVGMEVAISGKLELQRAMLCFRNPEWERADEASVQTGRIVPVYPLTRNLSQKQLRQLTRLALDVALPLVEDPVPPAILEAHALLSLRDALEQIHYPDTPEHCEAARRRLAFDEFLVLQLGLVRRKAEWQAQPGQAFPTPPDILETFLTSLPFQLTAAQRRALDEILADMAQPRPMSRLLQGDVGSGKTVVAAAAALVAITAGAQVAVLAPTEVLAEQHARSFTRLYERLPDKLRPTVALLTGSTSERGRRAIEAGLLDGSINLLIGTHALLEDWVQFQRLGLAVIDEQHRFGVLQRATLRAKGINPDVLVMTATPIPRSLALVLHGDLDVSIIDELPPGRQVVQTYLLTGKQRERAYAFIRKQIEAGHQAFIIYPLVEESEAIDAKAATVEFERLQEVVFPDFRLGLLHGRMRPAEKEAVMTAFRDHELDILVSTAVVEVGIDVPNATVILIEGADRFGLAQLHQFRGRVGRGAAQSYCLLISDSESEESRQRLQALVKTHDGFRLAEIDLQMRGPGEFLGTRQSGLPDLRFASLADVPTLQHARRAAEAILRRDPTLSRPEHRLLRQRMEQFWQPGVGDVS